MVRTSATSVALTILKNIIFFGALIGCWIAYETGYFSNDRISRDDWTALASFSSTHKGRSVYEADFTPNLLKRRDDSAGDWNFYNNARPETITVDGGVLTMNYSRAWLGVRFNHSAFEPKALYRVRFEAKIDGQAGAILMRNRQLDYMRQHLPTTDGIFREFIVDYAAPAGRYDNVRVIFIPDGRGEVSGSLSLRKFRIERLEK